jgi:hypothetical protein
MGRVVDGTEQARERVRNAGMLGLTCGCSARQCARARPQRALALAKSGVLSSAIQSITTRVEALIASGAAFAGEGAVSPAILAARGGNGRPRRCLTLFCAG